MAPRCLVLFCLLVVWTPMTQAQQVPPGDKKPLLRLDTGGPTSAVTALAFSPDSQTLYAAGRDKVVQTWKRDAQGNFVRDGAVYRVPIGPGLDGTINTIALSPDGRWLAAAGYAVMRGSADFHKPGVVLPQVGGVTPDMRQDQGTIYVFDTRPPHAVRLLRGHRGAVLATAFAPEKDAAPLLVSAAREWDDEANAFVATVRLWDVDRAVSLAERRVPSAQADSRPGLAVWRTPGRPKQVRVAIAWDDGALRLWEVESGAGTIRQVADGRYNNSAARLDATTLLTTSFRERDGCLQAWNLLADGGLQADANRRLLFAAENKTYYFPRVLTLWPTQPGGPLDRAAVVLRVPNRDNEYRLSVVDLRGPRFGTVVAQTTLWRGSATLAVLAVSPDGRHLATAGHPDHAIRVYATNNLKADPQILHGFGTTVASVTFAKKGPEVGLSLKPVVPGDGGLIFNFTQRRLTTDDRGWRPDIPPNPPRVSPGFRKTSKGQRPVLAIGLGDAGEGRVELKENYLVTALAPLPPLPPLRTPLLAVAYLDELRQPWLYLYNALSGEPVRQYTGHLAPIRSLAFSGDGRLLASAADDQTVCVWSLTDLDKVFNQHGMIRGLAVEEKANRLVVAEVDKESLHPQNRDKVAEGQVIKGLVRGGQLQPLATPRAFYDAVWEVKPKATVTLRLADPAGRQPDRDVALVVGQGVDEAKPLFTLFLDQRGKPEERAWIGWNPNGPYETNAPQTEQRLGWHFNPTKVGDAPSFARAAEFHKEYYREGLLKHLVTRGNLTNALEDLKKEKEAQKLPEPRMSLRIKEADGPPRALTDRDMVRRPQRLTVVVHNFPPDQVETVQWQLDTAPWQNFEPSPGLERYADVSRLDWKRGGHRFRVRLRTRETESQTFEKAVEFLFRPPAPVVRFDAAWLKQHVGDKPVNDALPLRLEVRQPRFRLQAKVEPGRADQKVVVHLQRGSRREPSGLDIDREFELEKGATPITIEAVNDGAAGEDERWERTSKTVIVTFLPPKPPPRLTLETVSPAPGILLPVVPNQPVVVDASPIRVRGRISAEEELAEATRDKESLSGFKVGTAKMDIDEPLALQPGLQTFRFLARTKTGQSDQATLTVDYRPLPPELDLTEPTQGLVLIEGRDTPRVQLRGRLTPREGAVYPYQAVVRVNGKEAARPAIDAKAQTLTAEVPVGPGENRIEVRLTNQWQGTPTVREKRVSYRRPPRNVTLVPPKVGSKPLIDVVGRAESPSDLPLTGADINGRPLPPEALTVEQVNGPVTTWKIVAADVPLEKGKNILRLQARNADGPCLKPAVLEDLIFAPEPPPKAVVAFDDPQGDLPVKVPRYRVHFHVHSASPLQRVELSQDGRAIASVQVKGLRPNADGKYAVQSATVVHLRPGANPLRLTAVNDGGEQPAGVTITYTPEPVQVVIDKLELLGRPGQDVAPQRQDERQTVFDTVADGRLRLRGHVTWLDPKDPQLREPIWVRVRVNGFLQPLAALAPPAADKPERAFRVDLTLNRPRDNQITLGIPQLKLEEASTSRCAITQCRRPVQGQRLRLLVIGIGRQDRKQLTRQALEAFHARPDPKRPGRYTALPAFAEVLVHDTLTGYVNAGQVNEAVQQIKDAIETPAPHESAESLNDVVMLYYQGQETINRAGHFLWTSESHREADLPSTAVRYEDLTRVFADIPGTQVLLLDVARPGPVDVAQDTISQWRESQDSPVGVFRSAWQGAADVPVEARLITAWKDAVTQAAKLGDLDRLLGGMFERLARKYAQEKMFQDYIPPGAADLRVGREP